VGIVDAECLDGPRIQEPHRAAAMLDSERMGITQEIHMDPVEWTRDGFEISRSAKPTLDGCGRPQGLGECFARFDFGRAAGY